MSHGNNHITIIEPPRRLIDLRLGELWEYRDLIYLLVRRDFVAQYKQTILGPAWHVIQPLFTTLIFTLVFGRIAKIPTDGLPPFLFYMAGTTLWAYFSGVLTATASTFIGNAGIFGKVYFPRLVMPVSNLISKFIGLAIQLTIFVCVLIWYVMHGTQINLQATSFLLPVLILMMAVYSLAIGIIISALTTRYRDLAVVLTFGVQLYMYLTPIVYPVSTLPEKWRSLAMANPLAPIVETFRHGMLGQGTHDPIALLFSGFTILLTLMIGVILFNRVERTFMDTV